MGWSRIQAVSLTMLLPIAGVVVVGRASPNCVRFVHSYVTVPVRNRVSKATAEAWAKWRVAHPNWKPNPNVQRPKYIMTRKEAVDKVAFACSVPTEPSYLNMLFTPADFNVPPPVVEPPPMESTQVSLAPPTPPPVAEVPTEIVTQDEWPPLVPFVPPVLESGVTPAGAPVFPVLPPFVPPVGVTPEPSTLVLVALGIAPLALLASAKSRRANATRDT